jgi:hypothetical protein
MSESDTAVQSIKFFQSAAVLTTALLAIFYNKRLAEEMIRKFKAVYGRLFRIERVFESKLIKGYLRFLFILFGVCAIGFAVFNITGPIK